MQATNKTDGARALRQAKKIKAIILLGGMCKFAGRKV